MSDVILPREVAEQVLHALQADDGKLWPSQKRKDAITALLAELSKRPEPYATVRYDLSAIDSESAIRNKLIELGWTPPGQQDEPVCRSDGRCQYAIDSGAEGLGHCPKGKCVMPVAWPEGYEVRNLPADYNGRVWIEGQVRNLYDRAALAQQAEPVLNGMERAFSSEAMSRRDERQGLPASQQQAEPVQRKPLTDDEIEALFKGVDSEDKGRFAIVRGFARALEAAHNITKGQ